MKKIFILTIVVVIFSFWANAQSKNEALQEYHSIEGDTPYKVTATMPGPDGKTCKKIINAKGDHEYCPAEAIVDLETGEWKMP